jgi:phosphatidylinositol alpha-1,6-mannosyltransferase
VRVLPNTVGDEFVSSDRPNLLESRMPHTGRPRLLTVGRLSASERYKGQDLVIQALPQLLPRFPQLQYLIAGDGDDLPRLRQLAANLGVAAHVSFLGHVAHADLPDLYRLADLYVMPSSGEGFGIVYLEAMACGTPALGLAGDGSVDPLADGELGVVCGAPEQLVETLQKALRNTPERTGLAQRARRRFGFEHFHTLLQGLAKKMLVFQ